MEVKYLILARFAEFTSEGMLNLIGGDHDKFIADEYPHVQPLIVAAARVLLNREDCATEHTFRAILVGDDTQEVVAEGPSGTFPAMPFPADGNFLGAGIILIFQNTIFQKSGIYIAQLLIDDVVLSTARLRVAPAAYFQARQKSMQATQKDSSDAG
jgi:hypothetical protein